MTVKTRVIEVSNINLYNYSRDIRDCLKRLSVVRGQVVETTRRLEVTTDTDELNRYSTLLASQRQWVGKVKCFSDTCLRLDQQLWHLQHLTHLTRRKYHTLAMKARWTFCKCYELETLLNEALDEMGRALSRSLNDSALVPLAKPITTTP